MIRAVVFDLGKVLVDFDYGIAARALAARSRVPVEGLLDQWIIFEVFKV